MHYRPEIDGLRCIAVLSVVFHHADFPLISGGFLGVDVFFVISGYLITRIILGEVVTETFSLRNFYVRRIRRIMPAVVFVLVCTVPISWAVMVPFQFHEFSRSVLTTLFFVSNIFFWRNSGYFDASSEHKPLLHTWSLAVEEQFYLFFPLLMLLIWPFGRNRALSLVAALSVISFLIAEFAPRSYATASFFLLPTRAWEIGVGCILAFFPEIASRTPRYFREFGATLGLVAVLTSFFVLHHKMALPGFLSLLPVLGTALVIGFATQGTFAARFLAMKLIVAIGAISFSLYLWHQPVFVFSRLYFGSIDGWLNSIFLIGVSVILSVLTYRYIEVPFRGRGRTNISFPTVAKYVVALYALLVLHSAFAVFEERNNRFLFSAYAGHPALIDARVENTRRMIWQKDPVNLADYMNADELPGARVLVMGDSHSTDVYNVIQSQSDALSVFPARLALHDGCMAADDPLTAEQETRECIAHFLDVEGQDLFEPATHVIFAILWTKYSERLELMDIMVAAAIDEVQKRGRIAVVSPGAYHSEPMAPFIIWRLFRQGSLDKMTADAAAYDILRADVPGINRRLETISRDAGAEIFNRFEIMCSIPSKYCHALTPDEHSVYSDAHHTTLEGATFIGELARAQGKFDVFTKENGNVARRLESKTFYRSR